MTYLTHPAARALWVGWGFPPSASRPGSLSFAGGLLGLLRGRGSNLAHGRSEGGFVTIRAVLARGVQELLALASGVGGLFGFCHALSLADLSAPSEVRHG